VLYLIKVSQKKIHLDFLPFYSLFLLSFPFS
jgi:hypothetical protein